MDGDVPSTTVQIGPSGGTLALDGIGAARFGNDVLSRPTAVTLAATRTAETDRDWDATASVDADSRLNWELRITLGDEAPAAPVQVTVQRPPGSKAIAPFAQLLQRNAEELLDGFVRLESSLAGDAVRFTLRPDAFTRERRPDGRYEAIVILAEAR